MISVEILAIDTGLVEYDGVSLPTSWLLHL